MRTLDPLVGQHQADAMTCSGLEKALRSRYRPLSRHLPLRQYRGQCDGETETPTGVGGPFQP